MTRTGIFGAAAIAALALAAGSSARADDAAQRGAQLFNSYGCGFCHENGGRTAGKGPQLAGTSRTDTFIVYRIKHGKESAMPAWGKVFSDAQITDLIAYIRGLKN